MALQTSGAISLNDIANEFGGSTPHSISEYYGAASGIPASGAIDFADFYGASAAYTVEYLIVAGGGGPGWTHIAGYGGPGGGGAGGLLSGTFDIAAGTAISATVGLGGAIGTSSTRWGSNGGNSVLSLPSALTAYGGGGGGKGFPNGFHNPSSETNGQIGGSGGGGGLSNDTSPSVGQGASGILGQGNAGADRRDDSSYERAGSGGGAGGAAQAVGSNAGGDYSIPGVGVSSGITGTTFKYADGGHSKYSGIASRPAGSVDYYDWVPTGPFSGYNDNAKAFDSYFNSSGALSNDTAPPGRGGCITYSNGAWRYRKGCSGVIILKYPNTQSITVSNNTGISPWTSTSGSYKMVAVFAAAGANGTCTLTF